MNLKNLLTSLLTLVLFTVLVSSSAFAQTFVSNTNGNDITGNGSANSPYQTIAKGITAAAEGGTVIIDADTYNEAHVSITKSITLVSQVFNGLSTVTITNGVTVNGSGKTVNIGRTADGSVAFNLGSTNAALVLTAGAVNITQANVIIASTGTITRTAGTINETPTTTDVSVVYNGTASLTAGAELPASLGTGSLTVNLGAAATKLTVNGSLALSTGSIIVTQGSVDFNGTVTKTANADGSLVANNGAGTVVFANTISGARAAAGALVTATITNGAGVVTLTGGVSGTATFAFGLTNGAGTINIGAGTYAGPIVNNTAAGVINLLGSVTFSNASVSNGNAAAVVKLNGFQISLTGTTTLTNTGNFISATASTVGNGMISISGVVTTTGAGELPNVTVADGGKLVLGANTVVYGNVTIASAIAGAITDATHSLTVYGSSFTRSNNTPGNYTATGDLVFAGSNAQVFTPGASLNLNDLTVNKTSNSTVTLSSAVNVGGDLTITAGGLDLGNYNVNLTGASTFDNSGSSYSTTGVGYVVFQGASGTIQGTGTFGNILINTAGVVTTASDIDFSGTLYLYDGELNVANGTELTFVATTLVPNPTVKIYTNNTPGLTKVTAGGTGVVTFAVPVNLEYTGTSAYDVTAIALGGNTGGLEWTANPTKLNNVTINNANTVTGANTASTIAGQLSVGVSATLAQGANIYSLTGDTKTHNILGSVTGGTLLVTGSGSQVLGTTSTDAGNTATVNSLAFEPAANNAGFTSANLKAITGNLTLQGVSTKTGATATVSMNPATAALTGNLAVGNGTLGPNAVVTVAGTTTSTFGGSVTLTDGTLTLTRGGNSFVIGGAVTLTKGTLTLGSDLAVTGATAQAAGNLALGGHTYTQLGSVANPDFSRTGAGTVTNGTVTFDASVAAITAGVGATLVLPNVYFVGTANSVTFDNAFEISGSARFDNAATVAMTAGAITFSGNEVTVTDDAGAFTGAAVFTGSNPVLTLGKDYAFPTLTVNTAGTFTVAGNPANTARALTAGTAFTLTKGTVALGIHSLNVATAFTQTAGTITQTTGYLNLNVAAPVIAAAGFSVDNLKVLTTATDFGTSAFTVTKNLILAQSLTTSADGKLTLGNGATIERQGNANTLAKLPAFGTSTNVIYSTYAGAADIVTAKELPATVNNLTVAAGANKVIADANVTITGILSLANMFDANEAGHTATVTMANASTLELKINGDLALDEDLTKLGSMDLVYNGASATRTRELGVLNGGATAYASAYAGNVTFKSSVTLDKLLTLNGTVTFDGGSFDLATKDLNVGGNVVTTTNGGAFASTGGAAFVNFTGATNTGFTINGNWTVPANIKIRLNKSNNNNVVTLAGGNLDFVTNSQLLYFQKGSIATGDNIIVLKHTNAAGVPAQGFDRTGVTGSNASHVIGNVQKALTIVGNANAAVDLTRVEFPVGTENNYRPFALQFNTLPTANFTLTVSHDTTSPAGENGFPISATDASGKAMSITNYPDFYWLVKSSLTLQPAVQFDVEASAAGYTTYEQEGIQNIRFIRRFANNDNNPWLLQGGTSYDNSTNGTTPVVIVRNATGAISTQGARFTYSQTNLPPHFTAALTNRTVNEGDTLSFTYAAVDPDINQTAALSSVTLPTGATFNASTGAFKWIVNYTQAGTHAITIRATDGIANNDTTVTITVNNVNFKPVFSNPLAADTIKHTETLTYDFNATDVDGQTVTFGLVSVTPAFAGTAAVVPATGVLTFAPTYADAGKIFSVKVLATDGIDTTFNTAAITVVNGAVKGDADGNGSVQPADATRILNGVIGNPPFTTAVDSFRADASGNGVISSYDAYYVLYYIVNGSFPTVAKAAPASGEVKFGDLKSNAKDASVVSLPIKLNGTSNVNSALVELTIDEQYASYKNVAVNLPDGWYSATSYKNGKLLIAIVGTSALKDGEIATVNLSLKNKEAKFEVNGNVTLNEDIAKTLASSVKLIPSQFDLSQNYPNPFNPTTNIKYQLAADTKVSLVVYDMLGQKVASIVNGVQEAGYYTVQWNGMNDFGQKVSSGVYIFRLVAGDFVSVKKMNLLK
jgi:hypothetical protein